MPLKAKKGLHCSEQNILLQPFFSIIKSAHVILEYNKAHFQILLKCSWARIRCDRCFFVILRNTLNLHHIILDCFLVTMTEETFM